MNVLSTAGAGIGALGVVIALATSGTTNAAPFATIRHARAPQARAPQATSTPCASQYPGASFIGFSGEILVAGAQDDGVLAGYDNRACDTSAGIGAGQDQYIRVGAPGAFDGAGLSTGMSRDNEFSGASENAEIGGEDASMGATVNSTSAGDDSFVGTSPNSESFGSGSFMGAGQTRVLPSPGAHGLYEQGEDGFLGAGDTITAGGPDTFAGAGKGNTISPEASSASIASGYQNVIATSYSAILGGYEGFITQEYGAILGGNGVSVNGTLGFAGGYHAMVANNGSFVWSDYASSGTISDSGKNQFVVRASGGTTMYSNEAATSGVSLAAGSGGWASVSDRNAKTGIASLDDTAVLAKAVTLPVYAWSYRSEPGVRHIGPMAQDFYAAFHAGTDDRHITSIDEDGVTLAAAAGLDRKLKATTARSRSANARENSDLAGLLAETRKLERDVAAASRR